MNTNAPCIRRVRRLYPWEVEAARHIFAGQLNYSRIRVHECAGWPDWIDKIGRRLKGMPPGESHNAVTLGNHCFFPVNFPAQVLSVGDAEFYKLCWLMHELTHAWQYQQMGWSYLFRALRAQLREKAVAYQFGDADGLKMRRKQGWTLHKFNLEQQGDIARSYYERLVRGEDIQEWQPFIEDIQRGRLV